MRPTRPQVVTPNLVGVDPPRIRAWYNPQVRVTGAVLALQKRPIYTNVFDGLHGLSLENRTNSQYVSYHIQNKEKSKVKKKTLIPRKHES